MSGTKQRVKRGSRANRSPWDSSEPRPYRSYLAYRVAKEAATVREKSVAFELSSTRSYRPAVLYDTPTVKRQEVGESRHVKELAFSSLHG